MPDLTTTQAAARLGYATPRMIQRACAAGLLRHKQFGRALVIDEADLLAWAKTRRPAHRPKSSPAKRWAKKEGER